MAFSVILGVILTSFTLSCVSFSSFCQLNPVVFLLPCPHIICTVPSPSPMPDHITVCYLFTSLSFRATPDYILVFEDAARNHKWEKTLNLKKLTSFADEIILYIKALRTPWLSQAFYCCDAMSRAIGGINGLFGFFIIKGNQHRL